VAERLYCSKGHSWLPRFLPDAWPPDFRSACAVCGEGPIGPYDVTATTARVLAMIAVACLVAGLPLLFISKATLMVGVLLLLVAGVIPLVGVGIWVGRQKTKRMSGVALAMEFAFMANLAVSGVRAIAPFRLFGFGHSHRAYNAMQGRVGDCDVLFFEYQYTVGGGKNSHTTTVSAVVLFDGAAGVPEFQLAPKTFMDRLVGFFTHDAVELEDAGEFSSRCKLTGPDQAALRETFHPDLVDYLGRDGRWFIQSADGQLLIYRTPPVTPEKVPGLVTDALEIRDLLRGAGRRTP
jgi:hypothetical protein